MCKEPEHGIDVKKLMPGDVLLLQCSGVKTYHKVLDVIGGGIWVQTVMEDGTKHPHAEDRNYMLNADLIHPMGYSVYMYREVQWTKD